MFNMLRQPSSFVLISEATIRRNLTQSAKLNGKKPETHYDVLNLSQDCSKRDIRNAFLRLSKQYHPDAAKTDEAARFVRITEAYQTLVKPAARKDYDDSLLWNPDTRGVPGTHQPWEVKPNYNPTPSPYYGIRGIDRVSNWKVALFLITLGIFGAIFGFSSVRHSFQLSQRLADETSAEANSHHASVVAEAQKYGNEEQLRRMVERLANDPLGRVAAK